MRRGRAEFNSADTPVPPAVDHAVVAALLEELGPEHTQEICQVFVSDASEKVDALQAAMDAGDADAAARAAHGLKSGSGFIGATTVHTLCAEIEQAGRAGDLRVAQARMADLREGLANTAAGLAELVGPFSRPS